MIPLLSTFDHQALVWSGDPSVTPTEDFPDGPAWIRRESATCDGDALVATVRALSHEDIFACNDGDRAPLLASSRGVVSLEGPGLTGDTAARLSRLPLEHRVKLGVWIITASTLPEDPTSAT